MKAGAKRLGKRRGKEILKVRGEELDLAVARSVTVIQPTTGRFAIVNTGIITLVSIYSGLFKNISIFENLKKIEVAPTLFSDTRFTPANIRNF